MEVFLRVDEYIGPDCACDIEDKVRKLKGVTEASFNPVTNILKVTTFDGHVTREDLIESLERCRIRCSEMPASHALHREHGAGMKMVEHPPEHDHHAMMEADFKRRFIVSLVFTIPVLLMSPTIQGWFGFGLPRFKG